VHTTELGQQLDKIRAIALALSGAAIDCRNLTRKSQSNLPRLITPIYGSVTAGLSHRVLV
jgi:hypothetical protein